jgi:putative PIN family toxin of toxin-antitoxin system
MIQILPKRIVLDTNVCLDLFVFRDPRWQALLAAMQSGEVQTVTRSDCRTEWTLVIAYTKLGLDAGAQTAAIAEFDKLIAVLDLPPPDGVPALPVCRDPDDQKFLELAAAVGASCVITKDKALLKLAGKMRRRGGFDILSPEQWIARHAASQQISHGQTLQ